MIIKLKDFIKSKAKKIALKILENEIAQIKSIETKIQALDQFVYYQNTHFIDGELKVGENSYVEPTAKIEIKCENKLELEGNNYIGRHTEFQPLDYIKLGYGTSIQDRNIVLGDVEIGRFCLTAPNVYMSSYTHYYNKIPYHYIKNQDYFMINNSLDNFEISKKIIIEDDVWIGINSVIMSGVKNCKGAVIGSNSVVTKDVLPYEVVTGSPAKKIKNRIEFSPKSSLKYSEELDLPYFYSGFMLDHKNLELSKLQNGFFACNKFTIYLDKNEVVKNIVLMIKNYVDYEITIKHHDEIKKINSNEFVKLRFKTLKLNTSYSFEILNHEEKYVPLVIIESAFLE